MEQSLFQAHLEGACTINNAMSIINFNEPVRDLTTRFMRALPSRASHHHLGVLWVVAFTSKAPTILHWRFSCQCFQLSCSLFFCLQNFREKRMKNIGNTFTSCC